MIETFNIYDNRRKEPHGPLNFIALFIGNIYSAIDSTKHYSRQHSALIEIFFILMMENRNIFFLLTRLVSDSVDNSSEVSTTTLQLTFS